MAGSADDIFPQKGGLNSDDSGKLGGSRVSKVCLKAIKTFNWGVFHMYKAQKNCQSQPPGQTSEGCPKPAVIRLLPSWGLWAAGAGGWIQTNQRSSFLFSKVGREGPRPRGVFGDPWIPQGQPCFPLPQPPPGLGEKLTFARAREGQEQSEGSQKAIWEELDPGPPVSGPPQPGPVCPSWSP